MTKTLATIALLFASTAFAAAVDPITGSWTIHSNIAGNESDLDCKWVQTDAKLSGTCKGNDGKEITTSGTIDGSKIVWTYTVDYNGTPLVMTYTGTSSSEKMSGSVDVKPFGVTGDWSAIPSKPAAK